MNSKITNTKVMDFRSTVHRKLRTACGVTDVIISSFKSRSPCNRHHRGYVQPQCHSYKEENLRRAYRTVRNQTNSCRHENIRAPVQYHLVWQDQIEQLLKSIDYLKLHYPFYHIHILFADHFSVNSLSSTIDVNGFVKKLR